MALILDLAVQGAQMLLVLLLAPLLTGLVRKVKAHLLRRQGPPLIQPYRDLIRLLRKDPHKRLGYNMPKDLVTIKKHRFFRKIDWKALEQRELEPPIKPLITDPALAENFSSNFTSMALSPVVTSNPFDDVLGEFNNEGEAETELFGGFSFVASSSLLNGDFGFAVPGCR